MARSNASAQQTGQQGQANRPVEVDAYGRPIDTNGHRGAMSPAAPYAPSNHPNGAGYPGDPHAGYGYQGQQGYPAPGYGQPVDQSGYHQPDYAAAPPHVAHDPYAQQQGYPSQGYEQQPYPAGHGQSAPPADHYPQAAPQLATPQHFERYNPQAPAQAAGYDRYDVHLGHEPQAHDAHAYDQRHYEQVPAANPTGFGQPAYGQHDPVLPGPAAHLQPGHQPSDPRSWDFAQYPPSGAQLGHAHQPGYDLDPHAGQHEPRFADPGPQEHGWNLPAQGHYAPHQQPHYPGQGYEAAGAPQGQYGMHAGVPAQGYEHPHGSPEAGIDEEEDDAPRRGPRPMIVAAALVCAIAVGGGLAFGYKKLVADGSKSATPVVKADRSPVREKPRDPGGKEQPHTDKKFPNRLDEKSTPPPAAVAPQAPPAAPAETEGGPRRVTTVIINKDGTITPTAPPAPAGPPPGMVLENVPRPELRGPAQPERVAAPPVAPVQKAPPAQPRVADLPLPKVRPEPRVEAPQQPAPPPARKKPAVRDDLLAQQPTAGTPPVTKSPAGGTGFVAVLVSRRSREDALKSFADLHQKFPDILQGRAPDVREKDFGDAATGPKGVWYRLIVGPPGSREASQELCHKLAAQGFKGCFSMVY